MAMQIKVNVEKWKDIEINLEDEGELTDNPNYYNNFSKTDPDMIRAIKQAKERNSKLYEEKGNKA